MLYMDIIDVIIAPLLLYRIRSSIFRYDFFMKFVSQFSLELFKNENSRVTSSESVPFHLKNALPVTKREKK